MRGARVRLELLQFACLIVSQLGSISTLCLIPTVHSFSSLRVQRNTHGVLANPDLSQAMAPSKKKRTHAVFCISSAHRLASTSKPRFVGEKICLNQVIRSLPASKAVIKKKAATEYADGLYPAFSASGQDVWLPDYRYNCHGVVVSAVGARCGKAFKASGKWNVVANTHPLALDEERIDWDYAWRLLNNENWWIKSGSGQPFVKVRESLKRSIYLPPLSIQKQFAANLRGVESQISIAQRSLAALDSLIKSRFIEMFGDLSGYESRTLKECVSGIESGKSPKCLAKPREGNNPGVLKLSAISSGIYKETENKALPSDAKATDGRVVCDGDILLARKNTPELVGQSVFVNHTDGNIMFPDIVFRMHAKYEVDGVYLSYALAHPLPGAIKSLAHGSAKSMSNIPKSELVRLPIPLPPLALQREFATFVSQVDKSRFVRDHEMNFR
jgi:type I restriction enzyme S subunit